MLSHIKAEVHCDVGCGGPASIDGWEFELAIHSKDFFQGPFGRVNHTPVVRSLLCGLTKMRLCILQHLMLEQVNWCHCYLCLLFFRCVSRYHNCPTVLLTHPAEIGHGLHDHNLWGQLSPEPTKGGVGSWFNVCLIS